MGDPNGIGAEVLLRALQFMHPFRNWKPLIFGDPKILTEMNKILNAPFSFKSISEKKQSPDKKRHRFFLSSGNRFIGTKR
jgi:4-hydroxythreonine-4-phosphate dehydrogenase